MLSPQLFAEEGFWTFDQPPVDYLKQQYSFELTPEWLDHVQRSSCRLNDGGSGSIVSANGLVLTNYHVGFGQIQKLSTPENDYIANGFIAHSYTDEIPTTDLEIDILYSIENITERVHQAAAHLTDPTAIKTARDAEIARIEQAANAQGDLVYEVVELYNGSQFKLYGYRRYTDIRLVFAPEMFTAYFGGDLDNYTYPRWSLDFALFRIYENEKPLKAEHFLQWNPEGATNKELVFVSGHPGNTRRLQTVTQMAFDRDYLIPFQLRELQVLRQAVYAYEARGMEQARQARPDHAFVENMLKRVGSWAVGLNDSTIFNQQIRREQALRDFVQTDPALAATYGNLWNDIDQAYSNFETFYKHHFVEDRLFGWKGSLIGKARTIVEWVTEIEKPNEERLEDYRDSNLESLAYEVFSEAPVYAEKEAFLFGERFQFIADELGKDDPFVQTLFEGKPPRDVAQEAILNSRLVDAAYRRELVEGGVAAVEASTDPLIVLARRVVPMLRQYHEQYKNQVKSVIETQGSLLADLMFQQHGSELPPDANFTLRLSFGTVSGYPYNGTVAPYQTTLYGLFDRAYGFNNQFPFQLPQRYREAEEQLNLRTPYNFVLEADVVGGNSGSPVVNREGKLVGLIFDGNIESIISTYIYNAEQGRSVAVHPAIMLEVLDKIYGAPHLVQELLGS